MFLSRCDSDPWSDVGRRIGLLTLSGFFSTIGCKAEAQTIIPVISCGGFSIWQDNGTQSTLLEKIYMLYSNLIAGKPLWVRREIHSGSHVSKHPHIHNMYEVKIFSFIAFSFSYQQIHGETWRVKLLWGDEGGVGVIWNTEQRQRVFKVTWKRELHLKSVVISAAVQ